MTSVIYFGSEWLTIPANKLTLKDVRDSFNRQGGFLRPRPNGSVSQPTFDIAGPVELIPEGTFDFLNSSAGEPGPPTMGRDMKGDNTPKPAFEVDPLVKSWAEQEKVADLLPLLLSSGFVTLDVIATMEKSDIEAIGVTRLGDQKRLMLAKDRCHLTTATSSVQTSASDNFYPAANAVLASFFQNTPTKTAPTVVTPSAPPVTPDTDTQIKIFKDLTKTQAPRRCKSNCHRWKEPLHTCTPADKCPSSDHCGHPDLHPEEKKRKREQKKDGTNDKENRDSWKKRRKQERNTLLRVQRCPHFDDFYEEEMNKLVAENPRAYSLEKGSDEYALATSLVVQKYKTLKTRLKQEKAVIRQIKIELKGLPATVDQNEYIKKRKAELLAGSQVIFPGVNTTTTTTTTTTTMPIGPDGQIASINTSHPSSPTTAPSSPVTPNGQPSSTHSTTTILTPHTMVPSVVTHSQPPPSQPHVPQVAGQLV